MSKQRNTHNAVCKLCRRNKQEHSRAGLACPLPKDQAGTWRSNGKSFSSRSSFTLR